MIGIVVAKPKFTVVGGSQAPASASNTKTFDKGSFTMDLPKTWAEVSTKDSLYLFVARDQKAHSGAHGVVDVVQASGRAGRSMAQWKSDLAAQAKPYASGAVASQVVREPQGQVVLLVYDSKKLVKGATVRVWQYAFDAGATSYLATFIATPSSASVYAKVFAAAAASLNFG